MATTASQPKYPDNLIGKYRDVYVEHSDWYEHTYDEFKERMEAIGVRVDEIYFSGFWSQGDGACFIGKINNWGKYLEHLGYTDPILADCAEENWTYQLTHRDRYYHEYSVDHSHDIHLPDNPYDEEDDPLRHAAWGAVMNQFDLLGLEQEILEDLRDHMRDLYKKLEQEHDHLTSDEVVTEWLEANEIDPDELTNLE